MKIICDEFILSKVFLPEAKSMQAAAAIKTSGYVLLHFPTTICPEKAPLVRDLVKSYIQHVHEFM